MNIKDTFNIRKEYDKSILLSKPVFSNNLYTRYFIDSWNIIPLYGKVDTYGIPIMPKRNLMDYCSFSKDEKTILSVDPMSFFYNSFRNQYLDYYALGAINKNSTFFKKDIPPKRGYIDADEELTDYLKQLYSNFCDYQKQTNKSVLINLWRTNSKNKIRNFKEFLEEFFNYLTFSKSYFTRAGYVESINFSLLHTGLAVDVFEGDSSDDEQRAAFIKDPNFSAFLELCVRNNLKIDKQIPWRVYADIRTKPNPKNLTTNYNFLDFTTSIIQYIPKYKKIQDFFDLYYTRVVPYDDISIVYFTEFVETLKSFYKSYVRSFRTFKLYSINSCGKAEVEEKFREDIPIDLQIKDYLEIYLKIRNIELKEVVEEKFLNNIYSQSMNIYDYIFQTQGYEKAVMAVIKHYTEKIGTVAYRNPSLYELDQELKMP